MEIKFAKIEGTSRGYWIAVSILAALTLAGLGQIEDDPGRSIEGVRRDGVDLGTGHHRSGWDLLHTGAPFGDLKDLEMGVIGNVDEPVGQNEVGDVDPRRPVVGDLLGHGWIGDIVDVQADPPAVGDIDGIPN